MFLCLVAGRLESGLSDRTIGVCFIESSILTAFDADLLSVSELGVALFILLSIFGLDFWAEETALELSSFSIGAEETTLELS